MTKNLTIFKKAELYDKVCYEMANALKTYKHGSITHQISQGLSIDGISLARLIGTAIREEHEAAEALRNELKTALEKAEDLCQATMF